MTMLQGALSGMTMGANPAGVFNHINNFLCEHADVEKYATMFFGILGRDGNLEYINAGHPSPLLLRGGKLAEPFTESPAPVGLVPSADYKTACVKLEAGDTLVPFSDAVSEVADPDEQVFGISPLHEALDGRHGTPLEHLQKAIFDSVESFTRGASQTDDITVLLVRYRAAAQNDALNFTNL
jgi:phosphoserine phosphatase RsbU/P